jgi:phospholipase C
MSKITNVFVLALENRSFDHMLGFSGITGSDAATGKPTSLNGLTGNESNTYAGHEYPVTKGAEWSMMVGPGHEFADTLEQLAGLGSNYCGAYPPINNSGFVADFVTAIANMPALMSFIHVSPGEVMRCYSPEQLPSLVSLAQHYAVCDNWFSGMPGPTWPNRFFMLAASSGGLDVSPSATPEGIWSSVEGFEFENGTLFDKLTGQWRIYAGGSLCIAAALQGVDMADIHKYSNFASDVKSYTTGGPKFTFIEPDYGSIFGLAAGNYSGGTSQHPLDDVRPGDHLIAQTYNAIAASPVWNSSVLIITWDEHGGFYDHVVPPPAVPPGDEPKNRNTNHWGFKFDRYGVRVPAVVVSPLIAKNTIDHRLYDHSSIPATVEKLFGLKALTQRDANANNLTPLLSLTTPRTDTLQLAAPAPVVVPHIDPFSSSVDLTGPMHRAGNVPGFLHVALRHDIQLSPPDQHDAIIARAQKVQTLGEAAKYMQSVEDKIEASRDVSVAAKTTQA